LSHAIFVVDVETARWRQKKIIQFGLKVGVGGVDAGVSDPEFFSSSDPFYTIIIYLIHHLVNQDGRHLL
jgi:hypothetical protein